MVGRAGLRLCQGRLGRRQRRLRRRRRRHTAPDDSDDDSSGSGGGNGSDDDSSGPGGGGGGSDDDSSGSGGGGRDDSDDDSSGSGGGGGNSDDDSSGSGGGGGDNSDDDSSGSGGDDSDEDGGGSGRGGSGDDGNRGDDNSGAKVEISRNGIEVVYRDGTKEEIENGRYERKDANGRTVEERPATQADVNRLQLAARGARPASRIEVGSIVKVERSAVGMEIVYSTGWKEELENGRYELKDPNNNTVVERPATAKDRARMQRIGGS